MERAIGDEANDGVLAVLLPHVMPDAAMAVNGLVAMHPTSKPVLLCLPGLGTLPQRLKIAAQACFPVLPTVRAAARTFSHMWRYSFDLNALYETPELHREVTERALRHHVGQLVAAARERGRDLSDVESKKVLEVYGFAIVDRGAEPAGGNGYELQMGSRVDPEFGPVLWCAAGGRFGDLFSHRVVGLPPLNATLARHMLERSPLFSGLQSLAARGVLNLAHIDASLVQLSQFVLEQPGIKQVEINPLVVSAGGRLPRALELRSMQPTLTKGSYPGPRFVRIHCTTLRRGPPGAVKK